MTGDEIRALIADIDLSPTATAGLIGVNHRTMDRWLADKADVSEIARRFLLAISVFPELLEWLAELPDDNESPGPGI